MNVARIVAMVFAGIAGIAWRRVRKSGLAARLSEESLSMSTRSSAAMWGALIFGAGGLIYSRVVVYGDRVALGLGRKEWLAFSATIGFGVMGLVHVIELLRLRQLLESSGARAPRPTGRESS